MDPTTYAGTPLPKPTITGYKEVDAIDALVPGTWFYADVNGYNYIYLIEGTLEEEAVPEDVAPEEDEAAPEEDVIPEEEVVPDTQPADVPEFVEPDPQPADPPLIAEPPAATGTTLAFDGLAKITATGLQSKWYDFDLAAFGTPGHVYALYFDDGATVSFDAAVQLTSFDANFNMTTRDLAAGEVVSVADINGYSAALGTTGNSVCFVLASNPGNYTGLVADQPLSALPAVVSGGAAPATGDSSGVVLFASVFAIAALGFVLALPRRSKSK
jgi:hypothetical protein